jgi:hypothetical protein
MLYYFPPNLEAVINSTKRSVTAVWQMCCRLFADSTWEATEPANSNMLHVATTQLSSLSLPDCSVLRTQEAKELANSGVFCACVM